MKIYNTMTGKKEELKTVRPGKVTVYVCGPTVYDFCHIGNARPLIVFDVLRRFLLLSGYNVKYVSNYTDIDDKVIRRANEENVTYDQIAARYIAEYETDAKGLGVMPPDERPLATAHIDDIVRLVAQLMDKGYAYTAKDGVYFRVKSFADYGKLSHQPLEDLEAGARVDIDTGKENPMDFAVWKFAKPNEPSWDSPWGKGRPGWHIECSAMANALLGETIDIHCGGCDLIFPHHENEIAQSEAANGKSFAGYWMHNGFLNIENTKMSKSQGNFLTVRDAANAYGYETIRMFMLSAHYRSPINYSGEQLESAKAALERLYTAYKNLKHLIINGNDTDASLNVVDYSTRFIAALNDDLNTADAVGVLFETVREINTAVADNPSKQLAKECLDALTEMTDLLGLLYNTQEDTLDVEAQALIDARQEARTAKNWTESDRLRDELKAMGILLEDTPQGVKWRRL
jgi:cysteinyl-tRNA synthetase